VQCRAYIRAFSTSIRGWKIKIVTIKLYPTIRIHVFTNLLRIHVFTNLLRIHVFTNLRLLNFNCSTVDRSVFVSGMWMKKRKLEAVKFLWKRKHFEERSWSRKQTRKHLTFWGAGSIFHKTWGRDVEAEAGSG